MVIFDATLLMCLFRPDVAPAVDPATGLPVTQAKERLALLVTQLEKTRTTIGIPAPALSEILVRAGIESSQKIVEEISKSSVFRVYAFDALAAIEVATMTRESLKRGHKSNGVDDTWAKVKYDRQIVAIAKVQQATTIYSDDGGLRRHAESAGIEVLTLADLPVPPEDPQYDMFRDLPPDEAAIAAAEIAEQEASDLGHQSP